MGERQPEGFFVVPATKKLVGFVALLELTAASTAEIVADPAPSRRKTRAATGAAASDETSPVPVFIIDREAYQGPSPTMNATPILTMQRYLGPQNLAWDFLALAEPEQWDDYFAAADLPRAGRRRLLAWAAAATACLTRLPTVPVARSSNV